jgi:hypothetical protein
MCSSKSKSVLLKVKTSQSSNSGGGTSYKTNSSRVDEYEATTMQPSDDQMITPKVNGAASPTAANGGHHQFGQKQQGAPREQQKKQPIDASKIVLNETTDSATANVLEDSPITSSMSQSAVGRYARGYCSIISQTILCL